VEENAATAKTLENQSTAMNEQVGFFRLGGGADAIEAAPSAAAQRHAARVSPQRKPAASPLAPRRAAPPSGHKRTALAVVQDADSDEF
jgi:hypothetical protein